MSINLILASLPDSFTQIVLEYRMKNIVSTILELINLLKIAEGEMAEKKAKENALKVACFYCG